MIGRRALIESLTPLDFFMGIFQKHDLLQSASFNWATERKGLESQKKMPRRKRQSV
jgi:hypothetical protein